MFLAKLRQMNPFRPLNERDLGMQEFTLEEIVEAMNTPVNPDLLPRGDFAITVGRLLSSPSEEQAKSGD